MQSQYVAIFYKRFGSVVPTSPIHFCAVAKGAFTGGAVRKDVYRGGSVAHHTFTGGAVRKQTDCD